MSLGESVAFEIRLEDWDGKSKKQFDSALSLQCAHEAAENHHKVECPLVDTVKDDFVLGRSQSPFLNKLLASQGRY